MIKETQNKPEQERKAEKAVLSVRGLGRGTLLSIGKSTKKNRIAVTIGRYQR